MVNLDNVSFIEDSCGKKAVVLSIEEYEKMREQLVELEDIDSYVKVKNKKQEQFPISMVEKLVFSNESKIKIFREYRGYKVMELAKAANLSEAYLSQIENQKRKGSIDLYKRIAKALDIDIDVLI